MPHWRQAGALMKHIACIVVSVVLFGCDMAPDERYPGPWVEEASPAIMRVLNQHGVRGCENLAYRPSNISDGPRDPRGEFLVYCSSDRVTWTAWIVLPALAADRNLMGAGDIYEEIPPTFVPGADRI